MEQKMAFLRLSKIKRQGNMYCSALLRITCLHATNPTILHKKVLLKTEKSLCNRFSLGNTTLPCNPMQTMSLTIVPTKFGEDGFLKISKNLKSTGSNEVL